MSNAEPETATLGPTGQEPLSGVACPIFLPHEIAANRFRVMRLLGQGGMAQVFEAEDLELGQEVAIKVIRPELAANRRAHELLRREVLLARKVTHPNVCRIFDVFQHLGRSASGRADPAPSTLVLAMELVRGETLARRLAARGPLTAAEALPIVRQLAEALDAAHRSQVVHGDFKSGNVILEPSARGIRAVVTDFGLAQHASMAGSCAGGTTPYMAPEQLRRGEVTAASDIYALGVVISEMVLGRRPLAGQADTAGAVRLVPRLAGRPASPVLPPAWRPVLESCLAPAPRDRPASAGDVARSLEAGVAPASARLATRLRRSRLASAAARASILLPICLCLVAPGRARVERAAGEPPALPASLTGIAEPAPEDRRAALVLRPATLEAEGLLAQGLSLLERGDAVEAHATLLRALAADAAFALSHAALARAAAELGYHQRAREEALLAVRRSERLPEQQRLEIAAIAKRADDDLAGAAGLLTELWRFAPHHGDYGLQLAEVQLAAGKASGAIETLQSLRAHGIAGELAPRAELLEARALFVLSEFPAALAAALAAAGKAKAAGNAAVAAAARLAEADARAEDGDAENAAKALAEARDAYRRLGFRGGEGEVLVRLAALAERAGAWRQALTLNEQAEAIFAEAACPKGSAQAAAAMGRIWHGQLDLRRAAPLVERALAEFRALGDRRDEAQALNTLALIAFDRGDVVEAEKLLEDEVSVDGEIGDRKGLLRTLINLANYEAPRGDLHAARQHVEEALSIAQEMRFKTGEAFAQANLGSVLFMEGNLHAAGIELWKAIGLAHQVGYPYVEGNALLCLGALLLEERRFGRAENALRQALALTRDRSDPAATWALLGLARIELWEGKLREAELSIRRAQASTGDRRDSQLDATLLSLLAAVEAGQGNLAAARTAADRATRSLAESADATVHLFVAIHGARVELAGKDPAAAARRLDAVLQRFGASPYPELVYEARLLLDRARLEDGAAGAAAAATAAGAAAAAAAADLRALARLTHRRRYELIAQEADRLLEGVAAANAAPGARHG